MSKFVKSAGIQLLNGGYVSDKDGSPITNEAFINAQKRAEYIVTFAKHAKGKDFVGKKADSLDVLMAAVNAELAEQTVEFVAKPKAVKKKLTEQIAEEAMAFMDFKDESSKVEKMNAFMAEFVILKDFEDFGLFFEDGIVKLNKIYTIKDIVTAVKETIDLVA
jgi:hypothetical protein